MPLPSALLTFALILLVALGALACIGGAIVAADADNGMQAPAERHALRNAGIVAFGGGFVIFLTAAASLVQVTS